jgi:phosphate transporter
LHNVVDKAYPYTPEARERLDEAIRRVVSMFAHFVTRGDEEIALKQLRTLLREHVVWERNTVWREMIGLDSRGWARSGKQTDPPVVETEVVKERTRLAGRWQIPAWICRETVGLVIGIALFIFFLNVDWFGRPEERNCLALLALCTVFWTLEVIPLFATSILVPFLVVVLRVIRSPEDDSRLPAIDAAKYITNQMFSPTILLLIGGFTLAAGLSKHNIDKILSTRVLALAGPRPSAVLLAYMGVACFASMWISNVAAPVLCYSLIQPILRTLPSRSSFCKALILGIALASNVGGISSPISSPQNVIALEYMNPPLSWLGWFAVSIPVAAMSVVTIWALLLWSYQWDKSTVINPVRRSKEKLTPTQWFVSIVAVLTIALWCVQHQLEWLVGEMGIVAIVPMVIFYGTGVLRKVRRFFALLSMRDGSLILLLRSLRMKADFESYPWSRLCYIPVQRPYPNTLGPCCRHRHAGHGWNRPWQGRHVVGPSCRRVCVGISFVKCLSD